MSVYQILISNSGAKEVVYNSSNNNIAGNLSPYGDAIVSGKMKKETNKAASLEFMILPSNDHYDDFQKKTTFVYLKRDNSYLFRGRVSDIKTDIFKQRTITCEGDLAFLADSVVPPNKSTGTENAGSTKKKKRHTLYKSISGSSSTSKSNLNAQVGNYFSYLIDNHNSQMSNTGKEFQVGSITISDKNDTEEFERTSYQDTSSHISSELLSVYGGILRTRYTDNSGAMIDWLDDYSDTSSQEIRFGINLMELDEEPPCDEVWSVLLPIGDENLTISSANNGSKYLENSAAVAKYGKIVHYHKFSNCSTASKLLRKARKYLATHSKVFPDNLIVKAIDLKLLGESTDPLDIGDKIKVYSTPHGINKTMACIAIELDLTNPENNSYTIGTILPPDKEKKKNSLSEQYASSNSEGARNANNFANQMNQMGQDIEVAANNINVNAENIAVNAQNIAVNAENIAVVAKNISIAAETIDIKAQELTATFEDETGTLSTKITATANGIKAELSNATEGLESKIELTAESLTTEFNKILYGVSMDGSGGIYYDYTSKIQQSATSLTSDFNVKLYGSNGTLNNPTGGVVADYRSNITQTATSITSTVEANYVGKGKIASTINQTAQEVLIQASKINLSGYVTTSDLAATNANITNLTTGQSTATAIHATRMDVYSNFYIGSAQNSCNIYVNGSQYAGGRKVSFRGNSRYFLTRLSDWGSNTDWDLSHSHSVTTNSDGTITLGGAVATDASNRSFRIADTKAYKDGVSAARTEGVNSVTVSNLGRRSGYSDSYSSSTHNTTVYIHADASNGAEKNASLTVYGSSAYNDGHSDGYSSGNSAGISSACSSVWNTMSVSCTAAQSDNNDGVYDCARIKVHYYDADDKAYVDHYFDNVAMWRVYNEGYDDGYSKGQDSITISWNWVCINSDGTGEVNYYFKGSWRTHTFSKDKTIDNHN